MKNKKQVVVKVLRPHVKKIITQDLTILRALVKIYGNHIGNMGKPYWIELIEQLKTWLIQETDYEKEIENIQIMQKECSCLQDILIPQVYPQYCAKNVLTMEFIDGYSISSLIVKKRQKHFPKLHFSLKKKLEILIEKMNRVMFQSGYFHADLHPANVLITKEGNITLLDFGLIGYFDQRLRKGVLLFLLGTVFCSPDLLMKAIKMEATLTKDFHENIVYAKLSELCDHYRGVPASIMSNGQFTVMCVNVCLTHGVQFPWALLLYTRSALSVDGMILNLYPEFIFSKHTKKLFLEIYVQNMYKELFSLPKIIEVYEDIIELINKCRKE